MSKKDIKFFYMQDPENPKRVVTLARELDKELDVLLFAWAVNTPKTKEDPFIVVLEGKKEGDQFQKKLGRKIATGRLLSSKAIAVKLNGSRPIEAMLKFLINPDQAELERADVWIPQTLTKIAEHYIWDFLFPQSQPPSLPSKKG